MPRCHSQRIGAVAPEDIIGSGFFFLRSARLPDACAKDVVIVPLLLLLLIVYYYLQEAG